MDEHVFAAIIANDKAKAFLRVEKFDDTRAFTDHLGRHAAATAACATAKAATSAAAAITAASTAAAEPIATTAEAVSAATAKSCATATEPGVKATAFKAAVTKTVALVPATSATFAAAPFIKTHALFVFLVRPSIPCKNPSLGRQTQVFRRSTGCAILKGIPQNRPRCE
jgi:hypothetical protein